MPSTTPAATRAPVLAIVGRPNVGKSTLFNRILGRRRAVVEDQPGTTRDRVEAEITWLGRPLRLVDTGGFEPPGEGPFSERVREQVLAAVGTAAAVLFIVDARDGLTAADLDMAELLRRSPVPVYLVANKADNPAREFDSVQFYELGMGEPFPVSAHHGRGIDDLLDTAVGVLPEAPRAEPAEVRRAQVAIVGRPNVGKSALLNALLGEERVIVSEIPGTTRDVIDVPMHWTGRPVTLLDTAGIRRRGRVGAGAERHSVMRAQSAAERADVLVLVIDGGEGVTAQDLHIGGLAQEHATGMVVAVNKCDLPLENGLTREEFARLVRARFRFAPWAEVVFISALLATGLPELRAAVLRAFDARQVRVPTPELNRLVQQTMARHAPPLRHGRHLKVYYATQAEVSPPTFVLFCNDAELAHFSYRRYLENSLRRVYSFRGTAVRLVFKERGESE